MAYEWFIEYGEGGYCADCTEDHPHPLNNIVRSIQIEVEDGV